MLKLIKAGMSVCRLNLAHCGHAFASDMIALVRELSKTELETEAHVAIWLDINGPKVR